MAGRGLVGRVIVSVKGGRSVMPAFVNELLGAVQRHKAEMGLLITMANPTPGMIDAADHGGSYIWPVNGQAFPRIQIATVPDLLAGRRPSMPTALMPYIAAARRVAQVDQLTFDNST